MKTTVVQWFQWFGEAMTHALGSFDDRHLQPPPIGTQPYRDTVSYTHLTLPTTPYV